uniref:F-actin monooxygenase n=1 Tax=Anabas testudineus TaxID=64144 RepID=A0A3Q1HUA6_ANATE
MGETEDERTAQACQLFENFVQASTCKGTLQAFSILCRQLELDPLDHSNFYNLLKAAVSTWKVKALWTKLDKRAQHKVYDQNKACQGTRCLIIGGGPCGLRTAIELTLLGCKVVVIEKRHTFSRNNVLHLWPFTIHDLRGLGAKKFYGKFCAGSLDHISIRQLQLMLLKVSLILGVEIHVNVEFIKLVEPPAEQTDDSPGWRADVRPSSHPVSDFNFDVVIGADGRKNTLDGFTRKEFRGKLAIAITANFINRNTTAEAKVEEISGVAFIFNQKFFLELKEETGIDLENIVYYRDNTHYFVMTAKKQSLLDKGVILNDYIETERLLGADNVNQEALLSYAREAADFGTNYQLPSLDYAINHYGQPDVAMFDFTSMYASENAALIREKHGRQLLVALVGDSLLEPFWPMGTGCARGFLAAFDTAWMVRGWAQGKSPLEILAERESIYRLLPQTTTENISKNFEQYTIDPATRYPNLNSTCVRPHQVRHLYIDGQQDLCNLESGGPTRRSVNLSRKESEVRPGRLLTWCQKQTQGYRGVHVTNLTSSWKNGLALCALIHHHRPRLIDYDSLNEEDVAGNNQLAFDVAEREFGIQPVTTGKEMATQAEPDKLLVVLYLSKFYEAFRNSPINNGQGSSCFLGSCCKAYILYDDKKLEDDSVNKRRRKGNHYLTELSCHSAPPIGEDGELRENKVRSMATQLLAKFEENSSTAQTRSKVRNGLLEYFISQGPFLSFLEFPLLSCLFLSTLSFLFLSLPHCIRMRAHLIHLPLLPPPRSLFQMRMMTMMRKKRRGRREKTLVLQSPKTHPLPLLLLLFLLLTQNEFSGRSIKERAALLSSMFPGSNKPPSSLLSPLSDSKVVYYSSHLGHRTVGKVSSAIDAKAQILAILYETDHRPNAMPCVARKDFPPGLGGSDICHFCTKRVYVMERLSAEGYFFHRECFRCDVCKCTLRLGGHTFDSQEAKFYCKMHYAQRQSSTHLSRFGRRMVRTSKSNGKISKGSATAQTVCSSSTPKKRLMIPLSEKEKLLDWEMKVTSEENPINTKATQRPTRDRSRKKRPMSEGAFNLGSLFKQVSLKGQRDSGGVFSDNMGSLSRKRVNLFSSLRLKKRELSDSEGKDHEIQKEIKTILTNLRNKGSTMPVKHSYKWRVCEMFCTCQLCAERQRMKQEKTVAQQAKREQLKRLHRAQMIQRQLEEVGEKQRDLEERGVAIEKIIRGETDSCQTHDSDETQLYQSWFKLVLEKNRLARYESELMIFAQELELEDTQSRLQQDLRRRMAVEDTKKSASELQEEQEILSDIMKMVEKRDMLVSILEEQRLKERAEDRDLESLVLSKGYEFHWVQADDSWEQEKLDCED